MRSSLDHSRTSNAEQIAHSKQMELKPEDLDEIRRLITRENEIVGELRLLVAPSDLARRAELLREAQAIRVRRRDLGDFS
jgi:hypothetical protein